MLKDVNPPQRERRTKKSSPGLCCHKGRELAELVDDLGHRFDGVIDVLLGVVSAQAESDRAVSGGISSPSGNPHHFSGFSANPAVKYRYGVQVHPVF